MKLVLIHGQYRNSWESQGLGLIAAYVKKHLPHVAVSFFHGTMDSDKEVLAGCRDADIVGFSVTSPTFSYAERLAGQIKQFNPRAHTVLGGYHASALKERCLSPSINQVVVGEGEQAMVDILLGDRTPVLYGRPMEFSELVWVDRELIRNERHIQVAYQSTGQRITSFQSHRGCPHGCRFCADGRTKALQGGRHVRIRYREPQDLVAEMWVVADRYQLDLIKFSDPTWNTHPQWVMDFCREKQLAKLTVPFFANIHAAACSQRMFKAMADAGCTDIGLGIESGSERILRSMGKGITKDHVRRAVRWAQGEGIRVRGYFILGMPEESNEDLQATEDFAAELELGEYGFTILCPYPGTDFYSAELADKDWTGIDEYQNDFWRTNWLSNEELRGWQDRLTARFSQKLTNRQKK